MPEAKKLMYMYNVCTYIIYTHAHLLIVFAMFFITDMPKPAAELFHNIHLYVRDDGVEMVEHHVDLMDVNERLKLYPFWGGSVSTRFNMDDFLMEEYGQDESAFWQNDSRKCHWHEKGKVRLTQGEKRQGVVSHCAVVMGVRHGVGGNLISEEHGQSTKKSGIHTTKRSRTLSWFGHE